MSCSSLNALSAFFFKIARRYATCKQKLVKQRLDDGRFLLISAFCLENLGSLRLKVNSLSLSAIYIMQFNSALCTDTEVLSTVEATPQRQVQGSTDAKPASLPGNWLKHLERSRGKVDSQVPTSRRKGGVAWSSGAIRVLGSWWSLDFGHHDCGRSQGFQEEDASLCLCGLTSLGGDRHASMTVFVTSEVIPKHTKGQV